MAQTKQTENSEFANSNKAVVDIAKYQSAEDKVSSETSAFEQVMSQMNIADRHAFEVQYDKYWQQASDKGELLSVMICEIDYFDAYNAHYGHQGSAFMLLVVGLALKNICEKYDCYLARYEGEKFAILVKDDEVETSLQIAESLRAAVEKSATEHKHSRVSNVVTLSVGISSVYPTSMKVLMQKSDNALQSAKKSGSNQVCSNTEFSVSHPLIETNETSETPVSNEATVTIEEQSENEFDRLMTDMAIADRNAFNQHFVTAWKEVSSDKDLLSMVVCELDYFEEYTLNHGQQTSQDILLIVACTLKSICDEFDCFFARIEGAKFVALIKGGNATKGLKIAEAIRTSIQDLAMAHETSPVKNILTMSLGLSNIFPSDENSMKMLMSKVESALGEAQSLGYDQISVN